MNGGFSMSSLGFLLFAVLCCCCCCQTNAQTWNEQCKKVSRYQKTFNNRCDLFSYEYFGKYLGELREYVVSSDETTMELTINDYLTTNFFSTSGDYFNETHIPPYQDEFTALIEELKSVAKNIEGSITNITVEYLFATHIRSKFDAVMKKIVEKETNNGAPNFCYGSSFCDSLGGIFGLNNDEDLTVVKESTLGSFFAKVNNDMFAEIPFQGFEVDKNATDGFINELAEKGTKGLKVKDIVAILDTDYAKNAVDYFGKYPNYQLPVQPEAITESEPTTPTTKPPKVDESKIAVETQFVVGIPLGILFVGVLITVAIIGFVYKCEPVESHRYPKARKVAPIVNQQNILEMSETKKTSSNGYNNLKSNGVGRSNKF